MYNDAYKDLFNRLPVERRTMLDGITRPYNMWTGLYEHKHPYNV